MAASGLDGIELNTDRFMGLLVRAAPSAAHPHCIRSARAFPVAGSVADSPSRRAGESLTALCAPQTKLIGESKHVQNNPPKFVPDESKCVSLCTAPRRSRS